MRKQEGDGPVAYLVAAYVLSAVALVGFVVALAARRRQLLAQLQWLEDLMAAGKAGEGTGSGDGRS